MPPTMAEIQTSMAANTSGDIKAHHMQEAFESVSPFELIMGRADIDGLTAGQWIGFDKFQTGTGGQMRATGFTNNGLNLAAVLCGWDMWATARYGKLRCQITLDGVFDVAGAPVPHLYVWRNGSAHKIMHGGRADNVGTKWQHHVVTFDDLFPKDQLFITLGPIAATNIATMGGPAVVPLATVYNNVMLGIKILGWLASRDFTIDIAETP